YNRIRKKLKLCTNSGKGSTCKKDCANKCKCVEKWVEKKREEWQNINSTYQEINENKNDDAGNNLSSFLEDGPFKNEVDKAIKPCGGLTDFKKSIHCNGTSRSGNSEKSTKYDGVLCLIDNLGTKATSCKDKHSAENQAKCQESTPPDDDEPLEEENPVDPPNICPTVDTPSQQEETDELDINDIYQYKSPKYKTLIEVVLQPSKRDTTNTPNDISSGGTLTHQFTDNEWNELKNDFITNILQNEQKDIPNNNISANIPLNTHPNTLYFDNPEEKTFITKIHDRNLYSWEEISYNINMTNNDDIPISGKNNSYSGTDLVNDSLNSDQHIDIYDEVVKRKENELFGTNNTKKNTSTNSVAKNTNSDPITNQLELFHKWLDRHRNMCEKWKNKEDILNKLKEEWNKENNNNVDKTYNSDNKPSHNHVLNTDVSIQIDMDNPKTKNEITNMDTNPDKSTMDTILDDLEKYNEPYYYDFYKDDIYYDVNDDDKTSVDHINMDHNKMDNNNSDVPTKVQIEMNIVNNKKEIFEEKYPISDIWNI
ncbi:hypothetical protein PFTANZ_02093, partial [Plasmodium falciparum Tanzania (2000708)]